MSCKSILKAGSYLFKTYITAIPRVFYRSSISLLIDPEGAQCFLHQVLNAKDLETDDPVLGSADITDLIGGGKVDVNIIGSYNSRLSSNTKLLQELSSLAYLMKVLKPSLIFEIGTFTGRTTRLLAANSPHDCHVLTLDLEPDHVAHQIGEAFQRNDGIPESNKITQLYGDSRTFNFSPYYGLCDFVWVDACHDYEYVISDTNNALKLLRPGGWIGWHDYRHTAWWSGVTRCVRQLSKKYSGIQHLRGTTIAVMEKRE